MKKYKFKKITLVSAFITVTTSIVTVVSCDLVPKNKNHINIGSKNNSNNKHDIKIKMPSIDDVKKQINIRGTNGKGIYDKPHFEHIKIVTSEFSGQLKSEDLSGQLKNEDLLIFKLKPKHGYVWNDNTNNFQQIVIQIDELKEPNKKIDKPTERIIKPILKISGKNGKGIYNTPMFHGLDVTPPINGKLSGQVSNGDILTFKFKLKDGFVWSDGSSEDVDVNVTVAGLGKVDAKIDKPTERIIKPTLNISGKNGTGIYKDPIFNGADVTLINGNNSGQVINGDKLIFRFKLKDGFVWSDGSYEDVTVNVTVAGLGKADEKIDKPTEIIIKPILNISGKNGTGIYKDPIFNGADVTLISGKTSGFAQLSNGDIFKFRFKLKDGFVWSDGSSEDVDVNVTVAGLGKADEKIDKPTEIIIKPILNISGKNGTGIYKDPIFNGADVTLISGKTSGFAQLSNGDIFKFRFKLKDGFVWSDGSSEDVDVNVTVTGLGKADEKIDKPTEIIIKPILNISGKNGTGIYKDPIFKGADVTLISGNPSGQLSNGDNLIFRFKLKDGFVWSDGSSEDVTVDVTVTGLGKADEKIDKPTERIIKPILNISGKNGTGIYKDPIFNGADVTLISGKPSGQLSNGDILKFKFKLKDGFVWSDGSSEEVDVNVTVAGLGKADEKIDKPTERIIKPILNISGKNGTGIYNDPIFKGADVTLINGKTSGFAQLSNGDKLIFRFKLKDGFVWSDGSSEDVTVNVTVTGLGKADEKIDKPTEIIIKPTLNISGKNGTGIYKDPIFKGADVTLINGKNSGFAQLSNGDNLIFRFKLKDGFVWSDGSSEDVTVNVTVTGLGKADEKIDKPTEIIIKSTLNISGKNGTGIYKDPIFNGADVTLISGKPSGQLSNGDILKFKFKLKDGFVWSDGSSEDVTVDVTVAGLGKADEKIDKPTEIIIKSTLNISGKNGTGIYKDPIFNGADVTLINGNNSGQLSNGDILKFKFKLKDGFVWSDGSSKDVTVDVTVTGLGKADEKIDKPTEIIIKSTLNISGKNGTGIYKDPIFKGADVTLINGNNSGQLSNGDILKFKFKLKDGFVWSDGSSEEVDVNVTVTGLGKADEKIDKPTEIIIKSTLNISGKNGTGIYKDPIFNGADVTLISGKPSGQLSNGDILKFKFKLKDGFVWSDGSSKDVTVDVTVTGLGKADEKIDKPTEIIIKSTLNISGKNGTGIYNDPIFKGADVTLISGKPSGQVSNGDILKFKFKLKDGFVWSDGSSEEVDVNVTVAGLGKADEKIDKPTEIIIKSTLNISGKNGTGIYKDPIFKGADVTLISGKPSGQVSNGDILKFKFKLKDGFVWSDGSSEEVDVNVTVAGLGKADEKIDKPTEIIIKSTLNISGKNGTGIYNDPIFKGADVTLINGNNSGQLSNGDILKFKFKLKDGFVWRDGSSEDVTVDVTVAGLGKADEKIDKPTEIIIKSTLNISGKNGTGIYNDPIFKGADVTLISGKPSGQVSNGDILKFKFKLKDGFVWSDGSSEDVDVNVTVDGLLSLIQIPSESSIKSLLNIHGINRKGAYDMPSIKGADVTLINGNNSGQLSNGDILKFKFKLKDGFVWSDGSSEDVTVSLKVSGLWQADEKIDKPTEIIIKSTLNISGKNGTGIYNDPIFKGAEVTLIDGNHSGQVSNGDILKFKFKLKDGFVWSDSSYEDVTVNVTVDGLLSLIQIPSESSIKSLLNIHGINRKGAYDMPSIKGAEVTLIDGNHSGQVSNGDILKFKFKLKDGFVWSDGSSEDVTVNVTVAGLGKADEKIDKPTEIIIKPILNIRGINRKGVYDMPSIKGVDVTPINGNNSGQLSNGDILNFKFKLKDGFVWRDGSSEDVTVSLKVSGLWQNDEKIDKPTEIIIKSTLNISGKNGTGIYDMPSIKGAEVTLISGKPSGQVSNGDILNFKFKLKDGFVWSDGSSEDVTVNVTVAGLGTTNAEIDPPTRTTIKPMLNISGKDGSGVYDMPSIKGADVVFISGKPSGQVSNGDILNFRFKLKKGFVWSDNSYEDVIISFSVHELLSLIRIPSESSIKSLLNIHGNNGSGVYDTPRINGVDIRLANGKTSGQLSNGDILNFKFKPKKGFVWRDGSSEDVTFSITVTGLTSVKKIDKPSGIIIKQKLNIRGNNGSGVYDMPSIKGADVTLTTGKTSGQVSNGDMLTFEFKLKKGFVWSDGSSWSSTVSITITVDGLSSKSTGQIPTQPTQHTQQTHTQFIPFADFTLNSIARDSASSYIKNNLKNFMAGFVFMQNGSLAMSTWENIDAGIGSVNSVSDSGINVGMSFGGASGVMPSTYAANNSKNSDWLYDQYVSIINKIHNLKYLDWDIEGANSRNNQAASLRNEAIKKLHNNYPNIKLSVTVPTTPSGMLDDVWNRLVKPLKGQLSRVNVMAMDYGPGMDGQGMFDAAVDAAEDTGKKLSDDQWINYADRMSMVGVIPMIGKNDIQSEIFTLESARKLKDWAIQNHLGMLSMWSLTRDENGGDPVLNSGINTSAFEFANILKEAENVEWDLSKTKTNKNTNTPNVKPKDMDLSWHERFIKKELVEKMVNTLSNGGNVTLHWARGTRSSWNYTLTPSDWRKIKDRWKNESPEGILDTIDSLNAWDQGHHKSAMRSFLQSLKHWE